MICSKWMLWTCVIFVIIEIILFVYPNFFNLRSNISKPTEERQKIEQLIEENNNLNLEIIKYQEKIKHLINGSQQKFGHHSRDHEKIRISLTNQLRQLPFFIKGKLKRMEEKIYKYIDTNDSFSNVSQHFDQTYSEITEMTNSVWLEVMKLAEVDNASVWRAEQLKDITDQIQKKIHQNQFPSDCQKANKLKCEIDEGCGFGCQIHHVINCLIIALGTKRTLLPVLGYWHYSTNGWTKYFHPITNCTGNDIGKYNRTISNGSEPELWHITSLVQTIPLIPPAFPREFADKLLHLHTDPSALWISQFLKFLKLKPDVEDYLDKNDKSVNFSGPTVGIHIRRSDKIGNEAVIFSVDQYMEQAKSWFDLQSLKYQNNNNSFSKRVVLITDEVDIINETTTNYPEYEFVYDESHTVGALWANRYSQNAFYQVLGDILLLSKCDYIICTLSSNMCRLAYEYGLLDFDQNNGDFTHNVLSLDNIFFNWGQQRREQVAILNHHPDIENREIELKIGDILEVKIGALFERNRLDGFFEGTNRRTNKAGFYPAFKVKEKWMIMDFP